MTTTDLATRLRNAGASVLALRGPLTSREPWPLSVAYGTEPEADWGPREVLAHVAEMLSYWTDQIDTILAGDPGTAVPFGRVASDPTRLDRIATDRQLSTGRLLDLVASGLTAAGDRLAGLGEDQATRLGLHPTRGEFTVAAAAERFLVSHLEEHLEQLQSILARPPS